MVHPETAFGDEKAHGFDSLASVFARPRMSKPTPQAKVVQQKTTNPPPPWTEKGAKTLSNPHQCPIPSQGGGVGVSIDRCITSCFDWATPTGEAQFKIRSFIGVRNGIPMGRLLCCTISLASSWSLWDVQLIWRAVTGFNWKWRNTSWATRFFGKGKSVCVKFACLRYHSFRSFYMVDGGKSCFRSSERKVVSRPPVRADFTQQLSLRSSHRPLRKTNLCQAFLQQEVSHRFMFTHKNLLPIWLLAVWHWDTFQPKQFETH